MVFLCRNVGVASSGEGYRDAADQADQTLRSEIDMRIERRITFPSLLQCVRRLLPHGNATL
jgi:hypothetical protein